MPAHAMAAADTVRDQLVTVLHLRREDLPHALRGEIFPVARIRDGLYEEVLAEGPNPLVGESPSSGPPPATPLDSHRDFTIYDRGSPIGRFTVDEVSAAIYSCSAVLVGMGQMEIPDRYVRFGRFDPRVRSLSVSGQGIRYEYTLNYYLALGSPVPQHGFLADSTADPEAVSRLRAGIWTDGIEALSEYGEGPWRSDARWEEPRWSWEEGFRVVDLDRDGRLEAAGVLEAIVTEDGPPTDGALGPDQFVATAIVWASDRGPGQRPENLLLLRHARDIRHWDFGYHLAEVMDLDGDGLAEPFYQVEAWEYHGFQIYALRNGALEEVFSGAAYGC
ncbi:MAG: hypothetical protein ACREK3_02430 [Gemmatimonadota bacterium]